MPSSALLAAEEEECEPGDVFVFPASAAQARFYFLDQLRPGEPTYNIAARFRLTGVLNTALFELAVNALIARHEVLRTSIEIQSNQVVQLVHPQLRTKVQVTDLRNVPEPAREADEFRLTVEAGQHRFDLTKIPLIVVKLLRTKVNQFTCLFTLHHAVCDGWSLGIILRELGEFYRALVAEGEPQLSALPLQYADYACWQEEQLISGALAAQISYWKTKLGSAARWVMPTDHPRALVPTFKGSSVEAWTGRDLNESIRIFCEKEGVTRSTLFLTGWKCLCARYSGATQISIRVPFASRNRLELEELVGDFMNPALLLTDLSGDPSFSDALKRVNTTVLEASANQDLPYNRVLEEIKVVRSTNQAPFTQVEFLAQRAFMQPQEMAGVAIAPIPYVMPGAMTDLLLGAVERGDGWRFALEYNSDLYERATIDRMLSQFLNLLRCAVIHPNQKISDIDILGSEERARIVAGLNQTRREYPRESTIQKLFAEQVLLRPASVALRSGEKEISYRELDLQSSVIAQMLRKSGVGANVKVGVALGRSINYVVGILGVLKAGGIYVPMDLSYPTARLQYILQDSEAPVIITESSQRALIPQYKGTILELDLEIARANTSVASADFSGTSADSSAYIIYTSGSTGKPKGVVVHHRGVVRLVKNTDFMEYEGETFLMNVSTAFDVSTLEIWGPLLNGGTLAVPEEAELGADYVGDCVEKYGVTSMWLTAGVFNTVVDTQLHQLKGLRQFLAGGDVVSPKHIRKVLDAYPHIRMINGYGPTENSVLSACYTVPANADADTPVPIGRPIANSTCYVLDEKLRPVPVGVRGELYTGGDGVAQGYLNQQQLTAERFLRDPYSSSPNAMMYRTGDLARWRNDGNLDFFGRGDQQVKIRGFRIELEDIEIALRTHEEVRESVVIARPDSNGEKRLVAYVSGHVDVNQLREHVRTKLPAYMIPAAFVVLDALPLNASGKVDRANLPDSDRMPVFDGSLGSAVVAATPSDPLQEELVEIWMELLGKSSIGVHEDFFELGGNSLLAVRLVHRIEQAFGRKISANLLFQHTTVAALSREILKDSIDILQIPLITLRKEGTLPPLFFLHGDILGGGYYCRNLLHFLEKERPFYALPPQGLDGTPILGSIEEMAAYHVAIIREIQPKGPYYLGGYCNGGIVAFEIARQLREDEQEVKALFLIDASGYNARFATLDSFIGGVGRFLGMSPASRQNYFLKWRGRSIRIKDVTASEGISGTLGKVTRKFARVVGSDSTPRAATLDTDADTGPDKCLVQISAVPTPEERHKVLEYYMRLLHVYVPRKYDGRMTLLWTRDKLNNSPYDPVEDWKKIAHVTQSFTVDLEHQSFTSKNMASIADCLLKCLKEDDV